MSGHNKWSKIKHKKAATDAEKSKVFSKVIRLITVEAKKCGGDKHSPQLKTAIEKAKSVNMPNSNIERAISKGIGIGGGEMFETVYEGYGPGGSALIISALTDNKNRTVAEVKHILTKNNCSISNPGSASFMFTKTGNTWKANNLIELKDEDVETLKKMMEQMEDLEDIQEVFTNVK